MSKKQPEPNDNPELTCRSCKWLKTPYKGKDCRDRYKVDKFSRACVEHEEKNETDIDKIQRDPFFKKIKERLKTETSCQLDKNLSLEIKNLQAASVSTLRTFTHTFIETNKDMIKLSKLFAQTQANRERINEIIIDVTYLLNNYLYPMRRLAKAKILADFGNVISSYKTADDREVILSSALGLLEKRIERAENILEVGEFAIKNLDQNYWSLKAIKEIGEGISARRITDAQIMRK